MNVLENLKKDAPQLEYLVLDSNAIIKGHGLDLFNRAKRIVTIEEVLRELRDSKARDLLLRLPFEIEIRLPSHEAIKEGKSDYVFL
jgi:rRNA maturation endonuclease Nob1